MLLKQKKFQIILSLTLFSLSAGLASCGDSKQLEDFLSADPSLQTSTETESDIESDNVSAKKEIKLTKLPKETPQSSSLDTETEVADLPKNFPLYPQATLESIAPESTAEKGISYWRSPDSIEKIVTYYQQKWQDQEWQVIEPFQSNPNTFRHTAIVSQDNLDFTVFLTPASKTESNSQQETNLRIVYQTAESSIAVNPKSEKESTVSEIQQSQENKNNSNVENTENNTKSNLSNNSNNNVTSIAGFSDLTETPEQLQQYVEEVAALGITSSEAENTLAEMVLFKPNEAITRREYAQWLVKANNKYFGNSSGNKIRLASKASDPVFKDIGVNDPDFSAIQGLAEAGLIPSMLTGDSSSLLFQPDAPLTREDLIAWKVPLDSRQGLPKADAAAIQSAWGFQDASSINPIVLPALFADYQNSDRSNLKRVFGYTTLFQPKKPVTRAEAAASLWYFGYQGDGITAKEKLTEELETDN